MVHPGYGTESHLCPECKSPLIEPTRRCQRCGFDPSDPDVTEDSALTAEQAVRSAPTAVSDGDLREINRLAKNVRRYCAEAKLHAAVHDLDRIVRLSSPAVPQSARVIVKLDAPKKRPPVLHKGVNRLGIRDPRTVELERQAAKIARERDRERDTITCQFCGVEVLRRNERRHRKKCPKRPGFTA